MYSRRAIFRALGAGNVPSTVGTAGAALSFIGRDDDAAVGVRRLCASSSPPWWPLGVSSTSSIGRVVGGVGVTERGRFRGG